MENFFKDKVVVITGGASGIGKVIATEYEKLGAKICIIDIKENNCFVGDLSDKLSLESFALKVISEHQHIDILINNALPPMKGIDECSYEEFEYALRVGVTAPFYLAKLFDNYWNKNACIINISSSRDRMSQPQTESYSASKGGISALTHSLAISLAPRVRVNSISPGWINTTSNEYSLNDKLQHPVERIGTPEDIANMVIFLTSDKAGFITGENICIDGGMTKLMIYSGENGWNFSSNKL
ncbi:MAG: SDR family oxidoreductase [Bacteroidales bacterium]|nr:SDR family oxidoreductase [Bacteroidales bacterium]